MTSVEPLFPLVSRLTGERDGGRYDIAEGTLLLTSDATSTTDLVRDGVIKLHGLMPSHWCFVHDHAGAPSIRSALDTPPAVSVAAAGGSRVLLLGGGPLGVDVETLDRVALNVTAKDDWLAPVERVLLVTLSPAEQILELGCRWVLREAYGKASGRGLDLPLPLLAFTARSGSVALPSPIAPSNDGWTFSLHRRGSLIIGAVGVASDR